MVDRTRRHQLPESSIGSDADGRGLLLLQFGSADRRDMRSARSAGLSLGDRACQLRGSAFAAFITAKKNTDLS